MWPWLLAALLLVGFTSVVSLVVWLNSEDFQRRATRVLVGIAEHQTGEQVAVDRVRIRFWPPALRVDGLSLTSTQTDEPILDAEHIRAPLVLRRGGVRLGKLSLVQPTLHLHLDEDGKLVEFRDAARGGGPLEQLPWSSLEIVDGSVLLSLPDGEVALTELQAVPVDGPVTDVAARLDVQLGALVDHADLDLPGVVLGPDRLEIPTLELDSRTLKLTGRAEWPLTGDLDVDLVARAWLDELNVLMEPPRAVHGSADLDLHLGGTPADPHVEAVLLGTEVGLDRRGAKTPVLHYRFGNVVAVARGDRRGLVVERAVMDWGDGQVVASALITPELELHHGRAIGEDLSMAAILRAMDAAPTPWVDFRADVEASLEGPLRDLRLEGPFEMAVADLHVGNRPVDDPGVSLILDLPQASARGQLTITASQIVIDAEEVRGPNTRGSCVAEIGTASKGPLDVRVDLRDADLSDFQPLSGADLHGRGRVSGRIWGPFDRIQLLGDGDVHDFSAVGIPYADHLVTGLASPRMRTLELRDARALKGTSRYAGDLTMDFASPFSLETDVVLTEGRIEDVVGIFVDIPGLEGDLEGTLWLSGPINHMDGEADLSLAEVDLWGERFETGAARGYMDQGLFTLDDLRVTRAGGEAGVSLRGGVGREWALNMELIADGLRLERMDWLAPAKLPLSGRASLIARVDNTLFEPAPHGRVSIVDVRYAGNPVDDSVARFHTEDGVMAYTASLVGETITAEGTLGLWDEQPYALTARLDDFPAHIPYPVAADGSPVVATVSGDLVLGGHFGDDPSPVEIDADLSEVEIRWAHHLLHNTKPWRYRQDGRAVVLDGFSLAGGQTGFAFSLEGDERGLMVDGHGQVDMDLLRVVAPGLSRAEGLALVELSATGKAPDVEAVVDVELDATLIRHDSFPAAFEDVRARIRATDDQYLLENVEAGLGGGLLHGGGSITAERWIPKWYELRAASTDAQIQWMDSLAPAIGDAEVSFRGPTDALLLQAEVEISEMTFSDRIDWEDWVVEWRDELLVDYAPMDEEPLFAMDVHLVADETIRLRNNVAEGVASADLRVIGDTVRPGMVGRVDVVDGLAFLQDREFRIDRGRIAFRDPWTWDPDLEFDLITDLTSRERRYRVTYMIRGPFSDWTTETRSDPPLPQSDVNALLWFGVTADDLEEMGQLPEAVAQSVLDFMLADIVIGRTGEYRDEVQFWFDRLDIVTGVNIRGEYSSDPRLLVEKRLDDFGDVEVTGEVNTMRPEDWYVRAEKRLPELWIFEDLRLSGWYASQYRDRAFFGGGSVGVDVQTRWEVD